MAGRRERRFRKKVFVSLFNGEKCFTVFNVDGRNKDARVAAELKAVAGIKRMVCEGGYDYLCTFYDDEIIKKK